VATLDATVGGSAANSYVTDAEFVAFLTDTPGAPQINDPADRAKFLIQATHDLDVLVDWDDEKVGPPQNPDVQALRYPADWVMKRYSNESFIAYYPEGIIPDFVKHATMLQTFQYAGGTNPQANASDAIRMVKVDVIQVEFVQGTGTVPGQVLSDAVTREIDWWVEAYGDAGVSGAAIVPLIPA